MRMRAVATAVLCAFLSFAAGCAREKAATPDVKDQVRQALDNAGFKDLKLDVNNDKQLVTLTGDVKSEDEKTHAAQVAQAAASGFVVSNEIGIRPEGVEHEAKQIDTNLDTAIEKDFKAVIIANHLEKQNIDFDARNGVLTLKGQVSSPALRSKVEKLAATVPNVQQVVNELDVKGAKRPSGS